MARRTQKPAGGPAASNQAHSIARKLRSSANHAPISKAHSSKQQRTVKRLKRAPPIFFHQLRIDLPSPNHRERQDLRRQWIEQVNQLAGFDSETGQFSDISDPNSTSPPRDREIWGGPADIFAEGYIRFPTERINNVSERKERNLPKGSRQIFRPEGQRDIRTPGHGGGARPLFDMALEKVMNASPAMMLEFARMKRFMLVDKLLDQRQKEYGWDSMYSIESNASDPTHVSEEDMWVGTDDGDGDSACGSEEK